MQIYLVKVGGNLYLNSRSYGFFQSTTSSILNAIWFEEREEAEYHAKKTFGGQVIEYRLTQEGAEESEIDMLKASITELQRQRDELKEMNENYKHLLRGYQQNNV